MSDGETVAIAPVQHVCHIFEQQTATSMHSTLHSTPGFGKDLKTVLVDGKVFMPIKVRQHSTFKHRYIVPQGINCQKLNRSYAAQEANLHVATISILPLFYHALSQKKNCHVW